MDKNYPIPKQQKVEKPKDTLNFLYIITFGLLKFWIVKCSLIWTFIFQASVTCVGLFDILSNFSGLFLIKYGPSLFLMFYGLWSIFLIFLLKDQFEEMVNEIFDIMDLLEFPGRDIWREIENESKLITVTVVLVIILAIGTCIMVTFDNEVNAEFFYAFYIFERKITSELSLFFSILYFIVIFTILFTSLSICSFVTYVLIHHKFQVYVLNDILRNIASDYQGIADSILIQDREYQDSIYQRLVRFVHIHHLLRNFVKKFNKLTYVHINTVMLCTVVSCISITYYAMVMEVVTKYQVWAVILLLLCVGLNISLFFYTGQTLEDEHSKIKENVWACPWTVWNAKNRKCLIIIIENSKKPVLIGTEGTFVCEYSYGLKVINFMISTCMFLYTMTNR